MSTSNLAVVQAIYQAVARNDLPTVLQSLDEHVITHQATSLPYGGTYQGHDGFMQMGTAIFNIWDGFQTTPDEFLDAGDWVIVRAIMRGKAHQTGRPLDMPLTELWRLQDGKVKEIIPFYWDTAATVQLLDPTPTLT
ncbi:nuclear transport factor 2 family protein [Fibrisoma montanum]|uniref:Nuclear transport factor 2 family protein n=1 Tax=Fibrisoma montanum TaxID=2305895 RepID=A0A418LZ51_9BACT|nr:nuclear transport factor 2 family protein [Fibrisoma montanum]RIV18647.1 nuclear transport factor 2 family protein [Fibrisoma montanum]